MPPKSVSSAITLVSLSVLAAVEGGACDKRPESLGSATRSALPLFARAAQAEPQEMNYALADYGLGPHPNLRHVCGHYELRADGRLTTWDLFVGSVDPGQLRREVTEELSQKERRTAARKVAPRNDVSVKIDSGSSFPWPEHCPQVMAKKAQSVLVATRVL